MKNYMKSITFALSLVLITTCSFAASSDGSTAGDKVAGYMVLGAGGFIGKALIGGDLSVLYPTPTMIPIPDTAKTLQPQPGKALVIFLHPQETCENSMIPEGRHWYDAATHMARPSAGWNVHQPAMFDGDHFMGILFAKSHLSYQAPPGEHRFMIAAKNMDFLDATLVADKTYYVYANYASCTTAHGTAINAGNFTLLPLNTVASQTSVEKWMHDTYPTLFTDEQRQWLKAYAADIQQSKEIALAQWQKQSASEKKLLHSGV